jgi:hypothetical protein
MISLFYLKSKITKDTNDFEFLALTIRVIVDNGFLMLKLSIP